MKSGPNFVLLQAHTHRENAAFVLDGIDGIDSVSLEAAK